MSKKSTWDDIEDFLKAVINAIALASKWLYGNIAIVAGIMLLADIIIFAPMKGGWLMATINGIVFIAYALRLWKDNRDNREC